MTTTGARDTRPDDPRVQRIARAMNLYHRRKDALIQVLHATQEIYGYLPLDVLKFIAREMRVPPSRVCGVATFYHFFSLKPKGEHNCLVCTGTACYVKGAGKIINAIEKSFNVKPGEVTAGNKLGVQTARCIGACGLAPAVVLDNQIMAKVDPQAISHILRDYLDKHS